MKSQSRKTFLEHALEHHPKAKENTVLIDEFETGDKNLNGNSELSEIIGELQTVLMKFQQNQNGTTTLKSFDDDEKSEGNLKQVEECLICNEEIPSEHFYQHVNIDHLEHDIKFKPEIYQLDENGDEINQCDICEERFQSVSHLQYHIWSDHLENSPQISQSDALQDHDYANWYLKLFQHKKKEKGNYECRKCSRKFRILRHFQKHFHNMHRPKSVEDMTLFICNICDQSFNFQEQLDRHITHQHTNLSEIKCPRPKCKFRTNHEGYLTKHLQFHNDCHICGKIFFMKSKDQLASHIKNKHSEVKVELLQCEFCPFAARGKHALESHIAAHKMCDICGRDFCGMYAKRDFEKHMDSHLNKCTRCSLEFANPEERKIHLKTVHDHNAKIKKCDKCNETFKTYSVLRNHKIKVHGMVFKKRLVHSKLIEEDGKMKKCPKCDKEFEDTKLFAYHLRNGHLAKFKNCQCRLCGMSFSNTQARRYHERRHCKMAPSEEKFKCEKCDKEFMRNESLKKHVKRGLCNYVPFLKTLHNTSSGKFQCDTCGRRFISRTSLDKHILLLRCPTK